MPRRLNICECDQDTGALVAYCRCGKASVYGYLVRQPWISGNYSIPAVPEEFGKIIEIRKWRLGFFPWFYTDNIKGGARQEGGRFDRDTL